MRFADLLNIPLDEHLSLSGGWLDAFKKQCSLKEFKCHREAGSVNPDDIEADLKRVQNIIARGKYKFKDVFNMDETGLFWA